MSDKNVQKQDYIKRPFFSFCVGAIFIMLLFAANLWISGFSLRNKFFAAATAEKTIPDPAPIQQAFSATCYLEDPTPECLNSIEPVAP